ncbi:hypothetical protein, partial [Salmonella sp. SAL4437]|uniref:hypothetical protein n=1 Tax=Salmonella sp. SAL4437 TaxID=3159892 RepID=UPI003977E9DF
RYPSGPFNSLIGIGPESVDPSSTLDIARGWFGALDRDFTVYVRAHLDGELRELCEWSGFPQIADAPGLVMTDRPKPRALPPKLVVRTIHD